MSERKSKNLENTRCFPRKTSQSLESTPSMDTLRWSTRSETAFDMSKVPDLIPQQSDPNKLWNCNLSRLRNNICTQTSRVTACFSGFFPKALMVLNQLIIFVVFMNYLKGKPDTVDVLSYRPDSGDYNAMRTELLRLRKSLMDLQKNQDDNLEWRQEFKNFVQNGILNEKFHFICNIDSKIRDAIHLFDADKIGIIDYALESSGAAIISTPETKPCKSKVTYNLFQFFDYEPSSNPRTIIQPGIMPGQCYGFVGSTGKIRIKLSKEVIINSVTLEHAHKLLLSDLRSAPKDFRVYGLLSEDDPHGNKLGEFAYQINGDQLQMFQIVNAATKSYGYVELHIVNNYGHPDYTCVYRFRVHSYSNG